MGVHDGTIRFLQIGGCGKGLLTRYGLQTAMVFIPSAMNNVIAAVAGSDAELAGELHNALLSGAMRYADLLKRARCDANWALAAKRLAGLAASFSATELQLAAEEAQAGAPGDPVALRKINRAIENLQL